MQDQPQPQPAQGATSWAPPIEADAVVRGGLVVPLAPLALPEGSRVPLQLAVRLRVEAPADAPDDRPLAAEPERRQVLTRYESGALHPDSPLDLPEGTPLRLHITLRPAALAELRAPDDILPAPAPTPAPRAAKPAPAARPPRLAAAPLTFPAADLPGEEPPAAAGSLGRPLGRRGLLARLTRLDALLLAAGMLVYAAVRLVALAAFPIYFFCDEAMETNLAEELLRQGMRSADGMWFPPYFRNVEKWSLSLTVYINALSLALFGKSVELTRGTSAVVSLLAGVAVGLTLRLVFRLRLWWAGPLVLSALPVWFLHSRTAFETVMMVAFYACFLCCYLLYRYHDPRWAVAAIVFGGATFYSYTNGQGVMLVSGVLLLLSDIRYHLRVVRQRSGVAAAAALTMALTAAQYIRFRVALPDAMAEHLSVMASVWVGDAPLSEKLATFGGNYLQGLSPFYWFSPDNGVDLDRHLIKGAGNMPLALLPFGVLGTFICLRQWRSSAHRAVLVAVLAAPFAAALVFIHNYRTLAMVVPAAILITIGLDRCYAWLTALRVPARPLAAAAGVILALMSGNLLRVSLTEGPRWYTDYGLYGMQYGAAELFPAIAAELDAHPDERVVLSHAWANNPNAFIPFFLTEPQRGRVQFGVVQDWLDQKRDIPPGTIFVMTGEEHDLAVKSGKLALDAPALVLPYPDGRPGFVFTRMRYVDGIDQILAAERAARSRLVEDSATLDGQPIVGRHSMTDLGSLADLFDDDPKTVLRGLEANPFVLELDFAQPRTISGLTIDGWQPSVDVTLTFTPADGGKPVIYGQSFRNMPQEPVLELKLPNGPVTASKVRIEIRDAAAGDVSKVHIRGLHFH